MTISFPFPPTRNAKTGTTSRCWLPRFYALLEPRERDVIDLDRLYRFDPKNIHH